MILDDSFFSPFNLKELAESLLNAGVKLFQLRIKKMPASDFLKMAKEILPPIHAKGGKLIINDRLDIAILSGADGVHLGQDDIPLEKAVKIFKGKIIGISTHNLNQAVKAWKNGASYIGFGPVFKTSTKLDADTVKDVKVIGEIASSVSIPVVAIGGITRRTFPQVLKAGATSAAVISAILGAVNPAKEVQCWINDLEKQH